MSRAALIVALLDAALAYMDGHAYPAGAVEALNYVRDCCQKARAALTPLAPEVPPRRDGLREALVEELYGLADARTDQGEAMVRIEEAVAAINSRWSIETRHEALAATRTPEPPDSGPEPRPTHHWNDPDGDGHDCADCASDSMWKCDRAAHIPGHARITDPSCPACVERRVRTVIDRLPLPEPPDSGDEWMARTSTSTLAFLRARSGSPAPEGGE